MKPELEADISRFYRLGGEGPNHVPDVFIAHCIGKNGYHADNCHPFCVCQSFTDDKGYWKSKLIKEFDRLDDALQCQGAIPWTTSRTCSSCHQLPDQLVFGERLK